MPFDLVLVLAGGLAALVGQAVLKRLTELGMSRSGELLRRALGRVRRRLQSNQPPLVRSSQHYRLGRIDVPYTLITAEFYPPRALRRLYRPGQHHLPQDLAALRKLKAADYAEREKRGERFRHNSSKWKVVSFDTSGREVVNGAELATLVLHFTDTDYYTQEVTDNDLTRRNPARDRHRFAEGVDLAKSPIAAFASVFGVTVALVTRDDYLLVALRSPHAAVGPGRLSASMSEGALRPTDADAEGAPDPYRTAVRGIREEHGLEVAEEQIEFLGFGADSETGIYNLLGWARLDQTSAEVMELRQFHPPTDGWEQTITPVAFNPKSFAEFCEVNDRDWTPVGIVTIALAFDRAGESRETLERALGEAARKRLRTRRAGRS